MNAHNQHFSPENELHLSRVIHEINVDLFAGGGGASLGLELGLGDAVHIAVNHNPHAISMHKVNHPLAVHFETDVWDVDPVDALAGQNIGWFHASPDCTHHSQAASGQPRKKEIRDLSWVVCKWAGVAKPRIISLENVKQIRSWGPLVAKRCRSTGRVIKLDGSVAALGERTPRDQQYLIPDPKLKGTTWLKFLNQLRKLGYSVEYRILKASDYGAPTHRERLFLIARRDGMPIIWPQPTHGNKFGLKSYSTTADCTDWSLPTTSIFERSKPLANATLLKIATGVCQEVSGNITPFVIPGSEIKGKAKIANLLHLRGNCDIRRIDAPLQTISAGGNHHGLIAYHLIERDQLIELMPRQEIAKLRQCLMLMKVHSTAFQFNSLDMSSLDLRDAFDLLSINIHDKCYVMYDISLRMLEPSELFLAQGFPPEYIIDKGHDGRKFTKSQQRYMCGNSVSPLLMQAIARANTTQTNCIYQ